MNKLATFDDLKGKSVFITGGGSGIGAALTEGFVAQGAKVAFVQRSDAADFVAKLKDRYAKAPLFIKCDLCDVVALKAAIAQAAKTHGPIEVLVNNAANDVRHELDEYSADDFDRNIAINLRPYFFTAQAVAPAMKASGGGVIINFSSISYLMGNAGYPAYVSANAAITGLTRALARDLGPANIRVNALAPGWVLTAKQKAKWATPENLAAHLGRQCLKEHLAPEDMVAPTLFLASDTSRMMTGQVMPVDGGVVVTG